MTYTIPEVIKKYNVASAVKQTWDDKYKEVFKYTMPQRDGYDGNDDKEADERRDTLYTSVGENSADEFVNTMQLELCPPQANWIDLEAGKAIPEEEREEKNIELEKIAEMANEFKNNSNFDIAFSEFCYDLVAGTACLLVTAGSIKQPLRFKAVPLKDFCIEEGANSEVSSVFRSFSIRRELVKYQWRELNDSDLYSGDSDKKNVNILECTYKDYATDKFVYLVIDKDAEKQLVKRVHESNPFVVLRWNKTAGEAYGRGTGMKALPDLKTLNLVKEYALRALAFNIPTFLAQQDASIDYEEFLLEAGAINVVPSTATNNPSIIPLTVATNPNIEQFHIDDLTMAIKQSMYANTLPTENTGKMTAYEVATREGTLNKNLTSVYGRLVGEFLIPLHHRIFEILESFGIVNEVLNLTERLDGYFYKVKVNSNLSNKLVASEVRAMLSGIELTTALDQTGQLTHQTIKTSALAPYLLASMGMPSKFINTKKEIQQIAQQQAEAQRQQQVQAMQDEVLTNTAMEEGKVNANK